MKLLVALRNVTLRDSQQFTFQFTETWGSWRTSTH